MSTQTLTLAETNLVSTDTFASQAGTNSKIANLPAVNDGSGGTVAVNAEIRIQADAGGPIEVRTADGRRVGIVAGYTAALFTAVAGAAESTTDAWLMSTLPNDPSAFQSIAGTYAQAEVTALRDCLVHHGLMKAE